jgi:hypothetical protein
LEILSESSINVTKTDSLGTASSYSTYFYAGWRIKDKHVPYLFADYLDIADNDLYSYPLNVSKFGLGYKHEFSPFICLKTQLEYQYYTHTTDEHDVHNNLGIKVQLAYGF